jgi:hypothetical protein
MSVPGSLAEWTTTLRDRSNRKNRELGLATDRAVEVFRVTAWGAVPTLAELQRDFPPLFSTERDLDPLARRLARWRGDP